MPKIRLMHTSRTNVGEEIRLMRKPLLLDRLVLDDPPEARTVREIIEDVRDHGDDALSRITARVDHAEIAPQQLRVPPKVIAEAGQRLEPKLRSAIRHSIASVRRFQESLLTPPPEPVRDGGKLIYQKCRPVNRVAVCVPGAAAPLPSSAIHSAVPAQVAGVKDIVLVAPPRHEGEIHPTILGVAAELGITEVYRMGGAQAIAALAIGTESVPRVDKIVGPGSVYVQLAKRYLFGLVDIDMFAGPSEVLVIADASAEADRVAMDLLAQAEHDPGCSILITDSVPLAEAVSVSLEKLIPTLSTGEAAQRWIETFGALVVVRNWDEAVELANDIAPEHLEIATDNAEELADRIDSAGAMFLGHYTPESAGDYVAGPSHVLPTGGTARFWSGVSALSFLRRSSVIQYTAEGLAADIDAIDTLARAEGLEAHARSATMRGKPAR